MFSFTAIMLFANVFSFLLIVDFWTIVKCFLTLSIGWFVYNYTKKRIYNLPPGPIGFPFLGCIPYLDKFAGKVFYKWSKAYGPVIFVTIGSDPTVVLNSYEAIEKAYIQQNSSFIGRYSTFFTKLTTKNKGIVFLNESDGWKTQRRFGSRALTGTNMQGITMEGRILEEADHLCNSIQQLDEKPFVLEKKLIISIANIISGIMLKGNCHGNEVLTAYAERVVQGFRERGFLYMLLTALPWSRHLPFIRKKYEELVKAIPFGIGLMNGVINDHAERFDPKDVGDLIDMYLLERQQKTPSFEGLDQLNSYLRDLFSAGTETTTSTIRWIIFYLIRHPEIQEKVHSEIDEVLGTSGKVTLSIDLPYTKAVIQEGYRIKTVTPLSVPRKTTRDVTLMGYHIPKNTQILANLWAVHHNSNDWDEPEKFIPERHLDKDGKFVKLNNVIPFSIGSRNCLGEALARAEVFLFVVKIMQKFKVLPNPDNPTPPEDGIPGVVHTPQHYPLIMKER